jgi:hypothetical protein
MIFAQRSAGVRSVLAHAVIMPKVRLSGLYLICRIVYNVFI